jgi:hypothetical protein
MESESEVKSRRNGFGSRKGLNVKMFQIRYGGLASHAIDETGQTKEE